MAAVSLRKNATSGWLAGVLMVAAATTVHAQDSTDPIRIGWCNWSDTEIAVKLADLILKDHIKQPVKLISADIGIHFQAMANGSIDLIPMVWLPATHKPFWDKYKDKLEDIGYLYEGRIGVAVPTSVPESQVASIEDLNKPEVKALFDGKLLTSEVGNGQYKVAQKAFVDYKLDGYKLVASSETGMLNELDRNLKRGKPSLINAWSPHWMFSKWSLRYLDDPKQVFGGPEQIHVVARKGFSEQHPDVAHFFANYKLPQADLEKLMMQARESSADKAVAEYYAANKAKFDALFSQSTASNP